LSVLIAGYRTERLEKHPTGSAKALATLNNFVEFFASIGAVQAFADRLFDTPLYVSCVGKSASS